MSILSVTWAVAQSVFLVLAQEVPDPEDVKPGWLGFGVFLLLAAAVVFLAFSFRKQLRKVDFEEPDRGDQPGDAGPEEAAGPGDGPVRG